MSLYQLPIFTKCHVTNNSEWLINNKLLALAQASLGLLEYDWSRLSWARLQASDWIQVCSTFPPLTSYYSNSSFLWSNTGTQRANPTVQAYFKHLPTSCSLTTHWSKEVTTPSPKAKCREVDSMQCEVLPRMRMYNRNTREWQRPTTQSLNNKLLMLLFLLPCYSQKSEPSD